MQGPVFGSYYNMKQNLVLKNGGGTGETAQWLRAHAAFPDDAGSSSALRPGSLELYVAAAVPYALPAPGFTRSYPYTDKHTHLKNKLECFFILFYV